MARHRTPQAVTLLAQHDLTAFALNVIFGNFCLPFVRTAEGISRLAMVLLIQLIKHDAFRYSTWSFIVDQYAKAIAGSRIISKVMEMKPSVADRDHAPAPRG